MCGFSTRVRAVAAAAAALALGWAGAACAGSVALKIATIAPDGSHWMQEMRAAAAKIKSATDGRLVLKFYPGGVMGDDAQVLRKVRIGQLQGGAFTSGGLAARYNGLNLYGMPLLFRSLDEVDYVRSRMDPILAQGLEKAGFMSFGFVEGGFAKLMSKTPVRGVDDMRRRKVWVPEGDQINFTAMQSLGLSPVVLPVTDVLTGLQTGLLDIVAASPSVALVLQWHTKVDYLTDLPVLYSMGVFAIDEHAWMRVDEPDRKTAAAILTKTMHGLDAAARDDNRNALTVLRKAGVKIVHVDPDALAELRREVVAIYPELEKRPEVNAPLFEQERDLLRKYRAAHPPVSRRTGASAALGG